MTAQQPNILLITTDEQRYSSAPPFRPDWLRTPHLDDMARKGVAFRRAYTTCPICVPARCTIMTGKHEWNHGMMGNGESSKVINDKTSLPSRLRTLGYQTMAIGKMHFGPQRSRHGFDDCLISADYFLDLRRRGITEHQFMHGLGQNEYYPGMSSVPEHLTYTSWTAERCVEYLHERREPNKPFFLWCSFAKPHMPFDPPEPYYSMYRNSPIDPPVVGDWASDPEKCPRMIRAQQLYQNTDTYSPELQRAIQEAYYGLITQVDYNLGRVFGALMDQGLFDNTLIVYTSDHGEFLGDHMLMGKTVWLEPSCHIPMIVQFPKAWEHNHEGTVRDELVCLADLLPTFVNAAGGEVDDDVDGRNMLEFLVGGFETRDYLEGAGAGGKHRAITDGRWKYIYHMNGAEEMLFDLENDPHELNNLADVPEFEAELDRLRLELIRRIESRPHEKDVVRDGQLNGKINNEPIIEREIRACDWLGFHTEYVGSDVMH